MAVPARTSGADNLALAAGLKSKTVGFSAPLVATVPLVRPAVIGRDTYTLGRVWFFLAQFLFLQVRKPDFRVLCKLVRAAACVLTRQDVTTGPWHPADEPLSAVAKASWDMHHALWQATVPC